MDRSVPLGGTQSGTQPKKHEGMPNRWDGKSPYWAGKIFVPTVHESCFLMTSTGGQRFACRLAIILIAIPAVVLAALGFILTIGVWTIWQAIGAAWRWMEAWDQWSKNK